MNYINGDNEKENIDINTKSGWGKHWEKYKIYHLVFGTFFFTLLVIFISNYSVKNSIRMIDERSVSIKNDNTKNPFDKKNPFDNPQNYDGGKFKKPSKQVDNWTEKQIFQENLRKEVETWINTFKYLPQYQTKEKPEIDQHALFYGPPGSGKTYLAEVFAENESSGYVRANFETKLWVGSSLVEQESILKEAKEILELKKIKKKITGSKEKIKPMIIIIDEIDSVGRKDITGHDSSSTDEVNGILKMIDNINSDNLNVIIIGLTNYPEMLDEALTRPGRLGRQFGIFYPSGKAIEKMIDYLEDKMRKGWKDLSNEDKWEKGKDDKNKIVEWTTNFWSKVRQDTKDLAEEYEKYELGFSYKDCQKAINYALATKSKKNIQKVIPNSNDYKLQLTKFMKERLNNKIKKELAQQRSQLRDHGIKETFNRENDDNN